MNYRPTTVFFPDDEFDPYDGLSKKTREMN